MDESALTNEDGHKTVVDSLSGHRVVQVGIATCLLTVLALLVGNVCMISLACDFNKKVCLMAAQAGASRAMQGGSKSQIAQAVQAALIETTPGGFFIMRPKLDHLSINSVKGSPFLIVGTVVGARLPAPILVWNGTFGSDGRLLFRKTCIVGLKNRQKGKRV